MQVKSIINNPPRWVTNPKSVIVLCYRIELTRNLEGHLFPTRASADELETISELIRDEAVNIPYFKDSLFLDFKKLGALEIEFIKKHFFLPPDLDKTVDYILGKEADILVNNFDHITIRCITSGLDLEEGYEIVDEIDDGLSSRFDYAFRDDLGYLSSCLTNIGTGLRVTAMLHLPGITLTNEMGKIAKEIENKGFSIRGIYGRKEEIEGNIFQLSNQITLGLKEGEIIEKVDNIVKMMIEIEEDSRRKIVKEAGYALEDKIWRAYGVLKNARMLGESELLNLLSAVRLGLALELIKKIDLRTINLLLLYGSSAHIQKMKGKRMSPDMENLERANYVRGIIGNYE